MKPLLALAALTLAATGAAQTRFTVRVVGRGRPVILIPGLACGGDVWDATVARLKGRYQCHVLTLAGFAGVPAVPGPFLEPVRDDIVAYVKAKRLKRPAVVGHSLGGFMAFSLASKEPALFGPIVAVDGVPWLTSLVNPTATMASAKVAAEYTAKGMLAATPEAFRASTLAALKAQITDPKEIERVAATSIRSDPKAVAEAITEMMVTDLRDEVAKVRSPVLLFAAGGWATTPEQRPMLEKAYQAQVAKVPNARIVYAMRSKHFVMLDEPALFLGETERFLKDRWAK